MPIESLEIHYVFLLCHYLKMILQSFREKLDASGTLEMMLLKTW